jgi:predicted dehydrogenase
VIVEKPMALSTRDADLMIKTAEKNGKKLAVCFQNRFNTPIVKTYEAIKSKRFGRMFHGIIQIQWNRNEDYYNQAKWRGTWDQDGGTLMNQCTHGIDLLQWLMGGTVKKVYGATRRFQRNIEAEDYGSAILEFDHGGIGIIDGSANIYPTNLSEKLSLFGEKGSVVVGGLAVNKIETWRFLDSNIFGDSEEIVLANKEKDPPNVYGFGHTALFMDFIDALEKNSEPLINGKEGRKALEVILAVYKSMKEGNAVNLPMDFETMQMKGIFTKG